MAGYARRLAVQDQVVEYLNHDQTGAKADGANDTVVITAPTGYAYIVTGIRIKEPGIAGSSGGSFQVDVVSSSEAIGVFTVIQTTTTSNLFVNKNVAETASSFIPNDIKVFQAQIRDLVIDDTNGLTVVMYNNSGSSQPSNRELRLWVRKVRVA